MNGLRTVRKLRIVIRKSRFLIIKYMILIDMILLADCFHLARPGSEGARELRLQSHATPLSL